MPSDAHAQIRRINLDGSGAEVIARGIRQIVGMDFRPGTNELYFTENARDWLSEDVPEDKLNRWSGVGQHFGYRAEVMEKMQAESVAGLVRQAIRLGRIAP
jgi:glucose/arabinose dehydrogenase